MTNLDYHWFSKEQQVIRSSNSTNHQWFALLKNNIFSFQTNRQLGEIHLPSREFSKLIILISRSISVAGQWIVNEWNPLVEQLRTSKDNELTQIGEMFTLKLCGTWEQRLSHRQGRLFQTVPGNVIANGRVMWSMVESLGKRAEKERVISKIETHGKWSLVLLLLAVFDRQLCRFFAMHSFSL